MEIKKQVLRVLSIGLILSVISPIVAQDESSNYFGRMYEGARAKARLYGKCARGNCSKAEKQQVWANIKSGTKLTLKLLAAAAVIGGGIYLHRKGKKTAAVSDAVFAKYDINIKELGDIERSLIGLFVTRLMYPYLMSDAKIKAYTTEESFPAFPENVLSAVAELYYGHEATNREFNQFLNTFGLTVEK